MRSGRDGCAARTPPPPPHRGILQIACQLSSHPCCLPRCFPASNRSQVALDDLQALLNETRGVMEKLAEGNLKLFSWQMVLWQPRFVKADKDALVYQKVTADERPIGKEKRIEFSIIREIEELEHGEFVLQCAKRDYTFKAADEARCEIFVHNLRQLIERWNGERQRQKTKNSARSLGGEIDVTVKGKKK